MISHPACNGWLVSVCQLKNKAYQNCLLALENKLEKDEFHVVSSKFSVYTWMIIFQDLMGNAMLRLSLSLIFHRHVT